MSDTLLHCFACDGFNPQAATELVCAQCGSDFVEIVQVERSPLQPSTDPSQHATRSGESDEEETDTEAAPGFQGMLQSILSSILPQSIQSQERDQPGSGAREDNMDDEVEGEISSAAHEYAEQPNPPPLNDFFSQMFGQFPQGRTSSPLGGQTHSRTTHGPQGSSFTFLFGTSSGPRATFAAVDPSFAQTTGGFPLGATTPDGRPIRGIPDIASFLAQALGAIPGTSAGDYASGETFDNIISELMNRNPQSNVRAASERAIAQIKRIKLASDSTGITRDKIGEECSICQDEYADQETLMELRCGHIYHEECLKSWLSTNGVCPICRAAVTEAPEQPPQDELD